MHQAIARKLVLRLESPLASHKIGEIIEDYLLKLAESLSINGIVPGHIKVFIVEKENYAKFSCTKPGKVTIQKSPSWDTAVFYKPELSYNVIVFGMPKDEVIRIVNLHLKYFPILL